MLRASSLGLRCYRSTLYRGVIRCSTVVRQVRERCYHPTARSAPVIPDGQVSLGHPAREAERFGEQAAGGINSGGGDMGIVWEDSNPTPLSMAGPSRTREPAAGVGYQAAHGSHRKKDTRTRQDPKGVKVAEKANQTQEQEDVTSPHRAFEEQDHTLTLDPPNEAKPESHHKPPWKSHDRVVKPLKDIKRCCRTYPNDPHREARGKNLRILAVTTSPSDAWEAYSALTKLPVYDGRLLVPWEHLHRLTRLICTVKPRSRIYFVRLLSVVSSIHRTGGTVQLWQWNALIDFAGKGYRKLSHLNFKIALDVFTDLMSNRSPGAAFSKAAQQHADEDQPESNSKTAWTPDIVTLTTLLDIATSTRNAKTIRHATTLIEQSGIPSNRLTYLVLLRYQARMGRTLGIRTILAQMASLKLELGLDGLNLCIWAYGRNNHLDVASAIYRVLRANMAPEPDPEVEALRESLAEQHIPVPTGVAPDHVTYTNLIQIHAYNGQLDECLTVFTEFISSVILPNEAQAAEEEIARLYFPAYRAIFLGFYRYGQDLRLPGLELFTTGPTHRQAIYDEDGFLAERFADERDPNPWDLHRLTAIFHDFLRMPPGAQPTDSVLFWIVASFAKTSGDDLEVLRSVYEQLESRFGDRWSYGGRLARVKKQIYEVDERRETRTQTEAEDADDRGDTEYY